MEDREYHDPVLVDQVLTFLSPERGGFYLDGTLGGGGHTEAILGACRTCRVLGVDQDPEAIRAARERLAPFEGRVRYLNASFHDAVDDPEVAAEGLSGALLDLGVSSHQLDVNERGFTMRRGAPLDMRMDPESGDTAADLLAHSSQSTLVQILRSGDAPRPASLAKRLVSRRQERPAVDSDDLVAVLESVLSRPATHSEKARLFQSLRIAVNDEIGVLERSLPRIRDALRPGGTFVVISYHSLEDRVVKSAFRAWSDPNFGLPPRVPIPASELHALGSKLTGKPVAASPDEVRANPRAKPARLRAWRRAA